MNTVVSIYNNDRDYITPPHDHDDFMFLLPEKGIMKIKDEDRNWSTACAPRQFIIVPPGQPHSTAGLISEQRHLLLYADVDSVESALAQLSCGQRPKQKFSGGMWAASEPLVFLSIAKRQFANAAGVDRRIQIAQIDYSVLLECLAIALSQPTIGRSSVEKHGAALVAQVVKLLENTLEDVPSLEQLAVSFGVSRRHLTRVFADVTGDTILGHVQKLRMERSKQLLRHTRLSIIEIALNVGFQSASHFAEIFRRATDMSPDQWRRSA